MNEKIKVELFNNVPFLQERTILALQYFFEKKKNEIISFQEISEIINKSLRNESFENLKLNINLLIEYLINYNLLKLENHNKYLVL